MAPASYRASELEAENLKRNAFKSSNRKLDRLPEKKDQVYLSPVKMGGQQAASRSTFSKLPKIQQNVMNVTK